MEIVRLALNAMNTRFELVLHGSRAAPLRALGEEALHEITRLEEILSAFKPTSEVAHINARAASEPVQVSSEVFDLLTLCRALGEQCDGVLDITIGPLMRCWGFWGASGSLPEGSELELARSRTGFQHLELNERHRTVRFLHQGMSIDLGAIGKGYAMDRAVELLREGGVGSALLHGGTSTTYAIGQPLDGTQWRVAIPKPTAQEGELEAILSTVDLCDNAIGVSALSEKSFVSSGRTYGHVLDPRSGWPVQRAILAAVVVQDATMADAWSTALMVLGVEGLELLKRIEPRARGLVVTPTGEVSALDLGQGTSD